MLALAIGLNVTVFTVVDATVFRGLPLAKRSDRLVYVDLRKASGARAPALCETIVELLSRGEQPEPPGPPPTPANT